MTLTKTALLGTILLAVAVLIVFNPNHWLEIVVGATTVVVLNMLGNVLSRDIEVK